MPCSLHFNVQCKAGWILRLLQWFTQECSIHHWAGAPTVGSVEKNNQNNMGHVRLKSGLKECLRGDFLFRKGTPKCATFPADLSHTQVLQLHKCFPVYHLLPQCQSNGLLAKRGSSPLMLQGCTKDIATTTKRGGMQKNKKLVCREGRKATRKGRARWCRRNKDVWKNKLSFAISIILHISQAPQAVTRVSPLTEITFYEIDFISFHIKEYAI